MPSGIVFTNHSLNVLHFVTFIQIYKTFTLVFMFLRMVGEYGPWGLRIYPFFQYYFDNSSLSEDSEDHNCS